MELPPDTSGRYRRMGVGKTEEINKKREHKISCWVAWGHDEKGKNCQRSGKKKGGTIIG